MKTTFIYDGVFCLKTHEEDYMIPCSDIYYFAGMGSYTIIHYFDKTLKSVQISHNISYFLHELDPAFFYRTHKKYVVNFRYVDRLQKRKLCTKKSKILMTDGSLVDISYKLRKDFWRKLLKYRGELNQTA